MNSPMITPMIAMVIAIFMPLKMAGSANGKRTITNDCHSDAVSDRHSRSVEGSALANPTAAEMTTGKKLTKAGKGDARPAANSKPDDKQRRQSDFWD